jgi:hypothetical protein
VTTKFVGVQLGNGMNYNESILFCFGIIGLDGGPRDALKNGLSDISRVPLATLSNSSHQARGARMENDFSKGEGNDPLLR